MKDPIERKRAKRPKTRTGCYNCKARHVKCDEEKPHCRRCTASNRSCQGYPVIEEKNTVVIRKQAFLRPRPLVLERCDPFTIDHDLSPLERQAIDFFRHQTTGLLPGSSWRLSWHQVLFETTMRMRFHEPAVAHISAALGSIHRAHHSATELALVQKCEEFAEHQCTKALLALHSYIDAISGDYSDTQAEVVLLISLLLFCFELWRSRDHAASIHLRSGLHILYERLRDRHGADHSSGKRLVMMDIQPRSSLSVLLQAFVRLDGDVIVSKGEPFLWPMVHEPLPASFLSMDEAMVHLDALAASINTINQDLQRIARAELENRDPAVDWEPGADDCLADALSRTVSLETMPELSIRMQESRRLLTRWLNASAYIPYDPDNEHAHLLARIHFFTLWYEMLAWREPDEMFTDSLQKQFVYILDQCERYVALHETENCSGVPPSANLSRATVAPPFSLGTNLVNCICNVAFKCRDSSIRRRSVSLVARVSLQGVFDHYYLTSFVQAIIDLEETRASRLIGAEDGREFLSHQIPAEARLLDIDVDRSSMALVPEFYKADLGHLVYTINGCTGNVEVHRHTFRVQRPVSMINIHANTVSG